MKARHTRRLAADELTKAYLGALRRVEDLGYAAEVDGCFESGTWMRITERSFLAEYAWVVLNSGFRESVVRRLFPAVSRCFLGWESVDRIVASRRSCVRDATKVFAHAAKVNAIADVAKLIADLGLDGVFRPDRSPYLMRRLPYLGEVTRSHLLKNVGLPFAKNDRHVRRLAEYLGFANAQELCASIGVCVGHPIAAVDTVLWRYSTVTRSACLQFELLASA